MDFKDKPAEKHEVPDILYKQEPQDEPEDAEFTETKTADDEPSFMEVEDHAKA